MKLVSCDEFLALYGLSYITLWLIMLLVDSPPICPQVGQWVCG